MLTRETAYGAGPRRMAAAVPKRAVFRDVEPAPVTVIAAHSGLGAGDPRTGLGPRALDPSGILDSLAKPGRATGWLDVSGSSTDSRKDPDARLAGVASAASAVASAVERSLKSGAQTLVLGGDHSIAAGTWSGAANALGRGSRLGLIWLDAHMDGHVPETTPSGNWHGMPVAHLLGHGVPELTGLARFGPALRPENLCLIGVRSYEPGEARLLQLLGVRVIMADEVAARGFAACFAEALEIASNGTDGFGVSIDLDAFDPRQAPGVGSPVAGGLATKPAIASMAGLSYAPGFLGLEIAEFNPARDIGGKTADLVARLVESVFETKGGSA